MLDGHVVVVTGAGRGIGAGIVEALLEAGSSVLVTDVERQTAQLVVDRMGHPDRVLAAQLDVTAIGDAEDALTQAERHLGHVTGWVNNAGVVRLGPALELDDADWQAEHEVNVLGLVRCCRTFARRLSKLNREGAIVNVASNAGKVGFPNMASYNATKAAVISVTRSLAREWATHGVNVNAVCPGGVQTEMLRQVAEFRARQLGADADRLLADMVPAQLGRHVKPVEVGRVVTFLLSPAASIIRGQAINVDAGETPY